MAGGPIGGNVYRVGHNYPGEWSAPSAESVATPPPVYGPYMAPPIDDNQPFMDSPVGAWSPTLAASGSSVETPSAQRIGTIPRIDMYPPGNRSPQEWYIPQDADKKERHTEETQWTVGREEQKDNTKTLNRWSPNPRLTPPDEPRPTSRLSPRTYEFTRPFDQLNRPYGDGEVFGTTRQFNGVHFSMADHRRRYPILGMNPPMYRRNTYRIEPTPWDVNIVDRPAGGTPAPAPGYQIVAVETPPRDRSFRLM